MTPFRFVLRMAWRETRAEPRRLSLLVGAVAIGVAALVAINAFTANLQDSVRDQARALLGADLAFGSRRPLPARVEALADSLGETARVTNFPAMAYVPSTAGTRLVQVSAVTGPFPFYGEITTDPAPAWRALQRGRRVVVDPALLTALGARVGDTLALGEGRFLITGVVTNLPGDVGVRTAFGPRVFMPGRYLDETGLLGFGSQARREIFVKLPPGASAQAIAERYRAELRAERVRIRTVTDDREDMNDVLARLGRYLGLVALIALLLGGIGVGSATAVFIRRKLDTIAVLRCLGATAGQVFAAYLLQAAALGLLGSVVGALAGLGVQQLFPELVRGLLPVDVRPAVVWRPVVLGVGMGVWVAVVFALLPLLAVRRVAPLAALRRPYESVPAPADPWRWPAIAALVASVVALATLQVGSWRRGLLFSAAVGIALGTLRLASWLLVHAVRHWFPARWPYVWRQGLANLYRPANQTVAVVLALGFGTFLLGTLFLVQHNLLRGLTLAGGPERPNLILFDVQTDQGAPIVQQLRARGLPVVGPVPIVPMRIREVRGRPVTELLAGSDRAPADDTHEAGNPTSRSGRSSRGSEDPSDGGNDGDEPANAWALRREYRSTYRDTLVASERLLAGTWWTRTGANPAPPAEISVEEDVARELGVTVGDEIVWDVQGVTLATRVASLREVDWVRFEPNFFVVFAPGALEDAPQTLVLLTRVEDAATRGRLQRELVEQFPNVTSIDLSLVQQALETLIARVALAIRFMALFSLATGVLVLVGAVASSRLQRLREAVLLKTLGATRQQIIRIAVAEHLALGLLSSLTALVLASAAAWALARWFFDGRFSVPLPALGALAAGVVALATLVGLWGSREVLAKTPLEALREE